MKNKFLLCLLAFALMGNGVEAQSYLKRMNDALNKASSKVDNAAKKVEKAIKKQKAPSSNGESSNPTSNTESTYSGYAEEKADTMIRRASCWAISTMAALSCALRPTACFASTRMEMSSSSGIETTKARIS